jgi:hypothetical protein
MKSEVIDFVRGSFQSIWSLELMLVLQRSPERFWAADELVAELRGSRVVVDQSLAGLLAAGFLFTDEAERVRYCPASAEIERLARETADAYRRKPDAVRRAILSGATGRLHMLADAFRLKSDP